MSGQVRQVQEVELVPRTASSSASSARLPLQGEASGLSDSSFLTHSYKVSDHDIVLARAHGSFSTGWRRRFGPHRDFCPCGCGLKGGDAVPVGTNRFELVEDGAYLAIYFEVLYRLAQICLFMGVVMLPVLIFRFVGGWCSAEAVFTDASLIQNLLGSPRLLQLPKCQEAGSANQQQRYLLEAGALLNSGVFFVVFVALPRLRRSLNERVSKAMKHVEERRGRHRGRGKRGTAMLRHSFRPSARPRALHLGAFEQVGGGGGAVAGVGGLGGVGGGVVGVGGAGGSPGAGGSGALADAEAGAAGSSGAGGDPNDAAADDWAIADLINPHLEHGAATDLSRSVLLTGLPAEAVEADVSEYLAAKLAKGHGARRAAAAWNQSFFEASGAPKPLLAPKDRRLVQNLIKYRDMFAICNAGTLSTPGTASSSSTLQFASPGSSWPNASSSLSSERMVFSNAEGEGDGERGGSGSSVGSPSPSSIDMRPAASASCAWAAKELESARRALKEPPANSRGGEVWNMLTAPAGLAILGSAKDALVLSETLGPGRTRRCFRRGPERRPVGSRTKELEWLFRDLRVHYPAPEPSDMLWQNMAYQDKVVQRRFQCLLLAFLYLSGSFVVQFSIFLHASNIMVSFLNTISTLVLRFFFQKVIGVFARPSAHTHFNWLVALLTVGGCIVSSTGAPFLYVAYQGHWLKDETWYGEKGILAVAATTLVMTALSGWLMDIGGSFGLWFSLKFMMRPDKRCWACCFARCLPRVTSFPALITLFEGPNFELGQNVGYACYMATLGVGSSLVLPGAPWLIALGLVIWYWKEKWVFLRWCRRPAIASPYVALGAPDFLAFAIALTPLPATLGILPAASAERGAAADGGEGGGQNQMREAIIWMGINATVIANFMVHGASIWEVMAQQCCRRRRLVRRKGGCRKVLRYLDRVWFLLLRLSVWAVVSILNYLEANWAAGKVGAEHLGHEGDGSKVWQFTTLLRGVLHGAYGTVVLVLFFLSGAGIFCRITFGQQDATLILDEWDERCDASDMQDQQVVFKEYVRKSPFHCLQPEPTLERLEEWMAEQ